MPGHGKIPNGKWSWNYPCCIQCSTTKVKHKSRGLCRHCWEKKRDKEPDRKIVKRRAAKKFYLKVRRTDWFREERRLLAAAWTKSKTYRAYLRRRYLRRRLEYFFTKRQRNLKRWLGGTTYRCEGCPCQCLIKVPVDIGGGEYGNQKMHELTEAKKYIIKLCRSGKYVFQRNAQRSLPSS